MPGIGAYPRYIGVILCAAAVATSSVSLQRTIFHRPEASFFPEFAGMVIYVSDVLLAVGLFVWFVGWYLSPTIQLRFGPKRVFLPLAAIVLISSASFLWAPDAAVAGYSSLRRILFIGMYVVLVSEMVRATVPMVVALIVVASAHTVVGLMQVALGEAIGVSILGELASDALEFEKIGNPQAYGFGANPNPVGMYLAITSVLSFGFFLLYESNRLMKGLTLLLFLAILVGMLATFSRSALLGWFIAISVMAFLALAGSDVRRGLVFQRIGIVMLIVGLLIVAGVVVDPGGVGSQGISGVQRFTSENVANGFSYMVDDFEASIPVIQDNFIRGVGAGNYPQALVNIGSDNAKIVLTVPVHNVFLLTFAEVGIIGGLAWIAITIAPIAWIVRNRRSPHFDTRTLIWVGPVLVLLFESLQDSTPWATQDGRVLMWGMLAMWVGALLVEKPRPVTEEEAESIGPDSSILLPRGH